MALNLGNIQGNIVPGFSKDHQLFLPVAFSNVRATCEWLIELAPRIASAEDVAAFNRLFKRIGRRTLGIEPNPVAATWLNIAFSWNGLEYLLPADGLVGFPHAFRLNHAPAPPISNGGAPVHALLLAAADKREDLAELHRRLQADFRRFDIRSGCPFPGATLPGSLRGHEQFGFKDGISQPRLAGLLDDWEDQEKVVAPGEFILGQPDEAGETSLRTLPHWTRDGSFLVFLQLAQDVGAFRDAVRTQAHHLGLRPEQLAAALIGRQRDGAYAADPVSEYAHIGRARPRQLPRSEINRHRIIRRGIPYGPYLPEGAPDEGGRGLLFLCYQASIERQFQHVWSNWLGNPDFPLVDSGVDPVVGQVVDQPRMISVSDTDYPNAACKITLPNFVSPQAGGYFFAPSIPALFTIARAKEQESSMTDAATSMQQQIDSLKRRIAELESQVQGLQSGGTSRGGSGRDSGTPYQPSNGTQGSSPGIYTPGPSSAPPAVEQTSSMTVLVRQQTIADYNQFIVTEDPYGVDTAALQQTTVEFDGPAKDRNQSNPFDYRLTQLVTDRYLYEGYFQNLLQWAFAGKFYRITKAVRIPYTYSQNGQTFQGSLFIGYQGPGWP
ncbi:MAG: Dyp-type peroxidase [Chloroflexi bacterium]|nr:Dyp-type peroxidase [Chloroflexota bacterium]